MCLVHRLHLAVGSDTKRAPLIPTIQIIFDSRAGRGSPSFCMRRRIVRKDASNIGACCQQFNK